MRRRAVAYVCVILGLIGVGRDVRSQANAAGEGRTLDLLQKLTLAEGTSGDEGDVRAVLRAEIGKTASLQETPKGDLVAEIPGSSRGPVILLSAHMDEVGFQVAAITPDGFLRVAPLGNWYAGSMADHLVTIRTSRGRVTGLVGVRPPHRMTAADKSRSPSVSRLYVDIGASSAEQARTWGVQLGDRIVPQSEFLRIGDSGRLVSKAWDDRVGCALIAETVRSLATRPHPNTVYAAWTTGEEFGRSNATVEMPDLHPDLVIVVEVGITTDTPDSETGTRQETLGGGPVLDLYDGTLSTAPPIRDWIAMQAKAAGIPLQYTTIMQEGAGVGAQNDSFLFRAPGAALLTPLRYAHSPFGVIDLQDYMRTRELLGRLLGSLDDAAWRRIAGKD